MGLLGGQAAALLAIAASYLLQVIRVHKITGLPLLRYGRSVVPATLVSVAILAAGMGARILGLGTRPFTNIAVAVGACIVAYLLCVPAFMRIREIA